MKLGLGQRTSLDVHPQPTRSEAENRFIDGLKKQHGEDWDKLEFKREPEPEDSEPPALWMIHIPIAVRDIHAALALADVIACMSGAFPPVVVNETTVTREDLDNTHRVYCDRDDHCGLRNGHRGDCGPREP